MIATALEHNITLVSRDKDMKFVNDEYEIDLIKL
ncbi:hypothetical protein ACFO25_03075 [Paenactinomyces guangxiensis]|nr:hypothetical protein [Paenactinomyces guangxiensis]